MRTYATTSTHCRKYIELARVSLYCGEIKILISFKTAIYLVAN